MSWRARSSIASRHGDRNGNHVQHQRSKTAIAKSKEERNQERELFIGWEGQDTHLQLEPIGIEVWGKRSSKPKQVLTSKHQDKGDFLPWDFYLCWTYTKCSTIPDYELFLADSLASKFKPEEEGAIDNNEGALQDTKTTIQSDATNFARWQDAANGGQSPSSVCVEIEIAPNADTDENGERHEQNTQFCAVPQSENDTTSHKDGHSPSAKAGSDKITSSHVNNETLLSKPVLNPVLSLADSRQSSISHSAPTLRTFDKIESERRSSSAEGTDKGVSSAAQQGQGIKREQLNAENILSSVQQAINKDINANNKRTLSYLSTVSVPPKTGDFNLKAANILETLRLETSEKDFGFDLPQTTHVSLGDILSSTPRLQRRLGTAKGRDPQVYAALHGNTPSPRPATPEPTVNPKSPNNSSRTDFDKEDSPRSPRSPSHHHETELPPVKDPRSSRSDNGNSPKPASPSGSTDEKSLPNVSSSNENGQNGKVALLSYRKKSDGGVTNGYPYRCGNPNRDSAIPDHHYRRPDSSPQVYENGDVPKVLKTRGPPGFRPQGQKTPLHRAMENAHKKLYGQHYHLFTQANYGQYAQQEKRRAPPGSAHSPSSQQRGASNRGQDMASANNKTWPQQIENRIRQYRSTTAPTRRMYHGTSGALRVATSNKHTGSTVDHHSNSKHNRTNSAQAHAGGDTGYRRHSTTDVNDNNIESVNMVSLRGKPIQR